MHLEIACDESGFSGGNLVGRDGARSLQVRRAQLRTNALAGLPDLGCQSFPDQQHVAPEGASSDVLRGCEQHGSHPSADRYHRGNDSTTADAGHRRSNESLVSRQPQTDSADGAFAARFQSRVHHWGSQAHTLAVVHDEQSALTSERIADIATAFTADHRGHRLTDVRFADSSREPAVQIADFVAGIARRLGSDELKAAQIQRSSHCWSAY